MKMQTYTKSITPNIIRTNRQITDLKALNPMDIKTFIDDTAMLDDRVTFSRCHAAGSEGVPGCFDVALDCICCFLVSRAVD